MAGQLLTEGSAEGVAPPLIIGGEAELGAVAVGVGEGDWLSSWVDILVACCIGEFLAEVIEGSVEVRNEIESWICRQGQVWLLWVGDLHHCAKQIDVDADGALCRLGLPKRVSREQSTPLFWRFVREQVAESLDRAHPQLLEVAADDRVLQQVLR